MGISLTIAEKKQILSEVYSNAIACLITGEESSYSFTVSGNSLTVTGHDFVNGCVVRVSNTGGSLPDGLESGKNYYVINKTLSTLQLSETVGGSAVTLSSIGSGVNTITEQPLIETLKTHESGLMPIWIRHEVDYQDSGRQSLTWGSPTINNQVVSLGAIAVTFAPMSTIDYRYLILVRGGSLNTGDATGEIMAVLDDGVNSITIDGKIFNIGAVSL